MSASTSVSAVSNYWSFRAVSFGRRRFLLLCRAKALFL
nr:MAG TPA: hypothetical protein [Caudoviricetes sp.]